MRLFRRNKSNDRPVIRQIIGLIPGHLLRSAVQKHRSDKYCHRYRTRDQLVALLFGQLCRCSTLEDISVGIGVSGTFIRDLGLEQSPAKSTMSDGNRKRDYRVFEVMAQGTLLSGWILVQMAMLRMFYPPLHLTFLLMGLCLLGCGVYLRRYSG